MDRNPPQRPHRTALLVSAALIALTATAVLVWKLGEPTRIDHGIVRDADAASTDQPHAMAAPVTASHEPPLNSVFDDLKSRADAGDAEAASLLYRNILRCRLATAINRDIGRATKRALSEGNSALTAQQLDDREKSLATMQQQLQEANKNSALCQGASPAQLQALVPTMVRAAQLGDDAAAACYVSGLYLNQDGSADHPEWTADYRRDALAVSDAAIARGDWNMVALVASAYAGEYDLDPFPRVTGRSAPLQYRYLKLELLGARDADREFFQNQIAELSTKLSPDRIALGDAWADTTFQHYFAAHPERHAVTRARSCSDTGG